MPLAAIGIYLLFRAIPYISPKGLRADAFREVLNVFQVTMVAFMVLSRASRLSRGEPAHALPVNRSVLGAKRWACVFLVIGNYLGKVRENFFLGIRTPWTLASDEVSSRTNRVAGYCIHAGWSVDDRGERWRICSRPGLLPWLSWWHIPGVAFLPAVSAHRRFR
ncbi:MAG: SdpI family protein [Woeseiaceae bacterium]|nr:SdpI family protein [Woeseiaceae bacterium]